MSTTLTDELYNRMGDDLELSSPRVENSEIAKYFAGKTLFITGITGFMGKCLAEKLLRSCQEIKHIYVLMRDKKNEGIDVVLKKYFSHQIFKLAREVNPKFEEKVTAMKGDLHLDNLGLSLDDRKRLVNEVDIIYHNAANVKFEVRVSLALSVNILGTKNLLDLAVECKQLKLFLYVSTAYSHCYRKDIDETFYPISDNLETVHDAMKRDKETESGLSEEETKALLGKFPNIYTYAKAFSEDLVRQYAEKYPDRAFGIYRPSIVLCTYREPICGWSGNYNGPVYLFLAVGLGMIHTVYDHNEPMDLIPADMAINAMLGVTWDLATRWKPFDKPYVYNFGSSTVNSTSMLSLYKRIRNVGAAERSDKAVWLNAVHMTPSYLLFWILHILLHLFPACLGDLARLAMGTKPLFVSIFFSVTKHLDAIYYFSNGNWRIHCPETMKVIDRMNYDDKELFNFDIRTLDWSNFIYILWRGLRVFNLKDDLNSSAGKLRYTLLWYLHYGLVTILAGVILYYIRNIFFSIFI